jgi:hypothetical protein
MWDFNTRQGIQAYVDEYGIEALREMVAGTRLRPDRRQFAIAWLADYDRTVREQVEADRADAAAVVASTAAQAAVSQAEDTRRAADAAEKQAEYARRAVIISILALFVSVFALLASVAALRH